MSRILSGWLAVFLALGLLVFVWWAMVGQVSAAPPESAAPTEESTPGDMPRRERSETADAPTISFIDDPTAQCYRPEQSKDACYIQWQYLQVSASTSQYIISMTVSIDNRIRAYYAGFFQNAMYVPQEMQTPGFRVACGTPGSGGNPEMGKAYSWAIRARETGGLKAANYGTVYCPADVVPVASGSLSGPSTGLVGHAYSFSAGVEPVTVTLPIQYHWLVSQQDIVSATTGISNTQVFTWSTPGSKQLAVGIANPAGGITVTHTIQVANPTPVPTEPPPPTGGNRFIYLPIIPR